MIENTDLVSTLNLLPIVENFSFLKKGDEIYSRKYGIGKVYALYKDDIILILGNRKLRISSNENDISLIPSDLKNRPRSKIDIGQSGRKITLKEMKRSVNHDYISISQVSEIFNVSKIKLITLCQANKIKIYEFRKIKKIARNDIPRLQK